jgi:hypothetical protein
MPREMGSYFSFAGREEAFGCFREFGAALVGIGFRVSIRCLGRSSEFAKGLLAYLEIYQDRSLTVTANLTIINATSTITATISTLNPSSQEESLLQE